MSKLSELLARWDSGDGKPYKGSLIDWDAYEADPDSIGCMCAQGQVLSQVGGWSAKRLHDVAQADADNETAKLLNISVAHAVLLRSVNDKVDGAPSIVLTHPEKVLGDPARIVLAFWLHMDRMMPKDWAAAWAAAGAAAWAAAGAAAWAGAGAGARAAARAGAGAGAGACSEIQGAAIMRAKGKPFFFLPCFGFADPEAIPALPADYGVPA